MYVNTPISTTTNPRTIVAGGFKAYESTYITGNMNVRGSISSFGDFFVGGSVSTKSGAANIGGDITTQRNLRVRYQTIVQSLSTYTSAALLQNVTVAGSLTAASLSTKMVSASSGNASWYNASNAIIMGPGSQAIQYKPTYLNISNISATIPSISTNALVTSNLETSNLSFENYGTASTLNQLTMSTAQIINPNGSMTTSTLIANGIVAFSKLDTPSINGNVIYANGLTMGDPWLISTQSLNAETASISTNTVTTSNVNAQILFAVNESINQFNPVDITIYSSVFMSSATLFSLQSTPTSFGSILTSSVNAATVAAGSVMTSSIYSPVPAVFEGSLGATTSSLSISSLAAQDANMSTLNVENAVFGTEMSYSTMNPTAPWLLPSTFQMNVSPYTTESGLGTYFNEVRFKATSDEIAYYSAINPAAQFPSVLSSLYVDVIAGTGAQGSTNLEVGTILGSAAADTAGNIYFGNKNFGWQLRSLSSGTMSTLGGVYQYYYGDGVFPVTSAFGPQLRVSVVPNSAGIVITDISNVRLRFVNTDPLLMTIAGTGQTGSNNGPALSATFNKPSMTAVDSTFGIYLADMGNNTIRRYSNSTLSVYAGTGVPGSTGDGGLATAARLASPYGVALDSVNALYLTDMSNCVVRRIDPATGIITKYAGTYTPGFSGDGSAATAATLSFPTGVALDPSNNMYICDTGNSRIRRIDNATGIISTIAGDGMERYAGDNGPGYLASLSSPTGVTTDAAGNLYIADKNNNCIRFLNVTTGNITTVAGQPPRPGYEGNYTFASASLLSTPTQVSYDLPSGNLYIADDGNSRVRILDTNAAIIYDYAGNGSPVSYGDNIPVAQAVFGSINAVVTDANNDIYVADGAGNLIRKVTVATGIINTVVGTGRPSYSADGPGTTTAIHEPNGMVLDTYNNIAFCDTQNNIVRTYNTTTQDVVTIAGTGVGAYGGDGGPATAAFLSTPRTLAFDGIGNLYIGDSSNYRVRAVNADTGNITTYAGTGTEGIISAGTAATASPIGYVSAVTTLSNALYLADSNTSGIWKVSLDDGTFQPVSAISTPAYLGDGGPISNAFFNTPTGLSVDPSGNLIVCDNGNYRLRRTYTYGTPQLPMYLNMNLRFTNYYATNGAATISINGNTVATFNSGSPSSTFIITDTDIFNYPLQSSNPVLGDHTPWIEITETGNTGYIKLDGGFWINSYPDEDVTENYMNMDGGIVMNSGLLRFPNTLNGISIQNEYNDASTRNLIYTGALNNPSDPALKERIHAADTAICYTTINSIPLRRYRYNAEYESTFRVQDRNRLGFLTTEVALHFPKSIRPLESTNTLETGQIKYAHFGTTQKLMAEVSSLEAEFDLIARQATQRNVI
jgi:sugar lactone lactonase YvrE